MTIYSECPNCGTKVKETLMFGNLIFNEARTEIIHLYSSDPKPVYCQKCGNTLLDSSKLKMKSEMESLNDTIKSNLDIMPVVSTHLPLGWEYDIIGMVTAQSVSGTGIFTEGSSAVDDFFGTQSVALSNKLKGGENFCFSLLRKRALDMGANAVIATDIDYAELGTLKGMIMVCMAGTAIRLKNLNILGDSKVKEMDLITISNERFRKLQALKVAIA